LGNNNVTSTTDIYSNPELASNLLGIYNNILNPNWQNAVSSGDFEGDLGANEAKLEYHLKSEFGRWDGTQWLIDTTTSPCIDEGDPAYDFSNEPTPNGSRINIGAFGNTMFTSKSPNPLATTDYTNTNINIYPNPTSDKIIFPNDLITSEYSIYSITGKLIKNGRLHTNEIKISELNSGLYILKIRNYKSNTVTVFKIIKE